MHIQTCNIIFPFMSDSCQIHVRFMLNSCIFNDSEIWVVELEVFSRILVQIWLGRGWCWIHVEFMLNSFMLNSCWFHFYLEVSQRFAQHLHHIGVEFMLNSCWIHAEFKRNREKYLNLPIKWHLKHLTGLFMLYTIRNTVFGISQKIAKIVKSIYFSRNCLNSAWIRHEFNTIVMQSVAQSIVKIKVKMKSAWNQHEFSMNSTWIQHHCYAKCCAKHCENLRWKWNQHEISMNSAWIQHEFNTSLILPRAFGDGKL